MNLTEHCKHTLQRYGVSGEDVHKWMDEPARIYGFQHRKVRHIADNPPKFAVDKYGFEVAQNIIIDHIIADGYNDPKKRRRGRRGLGKNQRKRKEDLELTRRAGVFSRFDQWYEVRRFLDDKGLRYPYLIIDSKVNYESHEIEIILRKTVFDGRIIDEDDEWYELPWKHLLDKNKETLEMKARPDGRVLSIHY